MGQEHSDSSSKRLPSDGAIQEARKNPGGWVYEINGSYGPDEHVPAHAVIGAWKVNEAGIIEGDFIPNPNFRSA